MTLIVEMFLRCDGPCCKQFHWNSFSCYEMRRAAKKVGWTHTRGKDYCGGCQDAAKQAEKVRRATK